MNGHKERLSVADAAKLLDITPEAIRQRIRRGSIEYEQDEGGKYYVYVTTSEGVENTVHNPALQDHIDTLKRELELRNEELRRKDHIIAALTERIPALEPPNEARESPVTASEKSGKGTTPPEQQERKRSWLYSFFFGPDKGGA